jgi:hypothetical protein
VPAGCSFEGCVPELSVADAGADVATAGKPGNPPLYHTLPASQPSSGPYQMARSSAASPPPRQQQQMSVYAWVWQQYDIGRLQGSASCRAAVISAPNARSRHACTPSAAAVLPHRQHGDPQGERGSRVVACTHAGMHRQLRPPSTHHCYICLSSSSSLAGCWLLAASSESCHLRPTACYCRTVD